MAQINVSNLTFAYEGSAENVFEQVSFSIDTNWKLGFIGRNGKGKTTFLNLLLGKYAYQGSITKGIAYDYFPYRVSVEEAKLTADELMERWKPGVESWRVFCEMQDLKIEAEVLYRPFCTLSFGERTKVMLAVLFSGETDFLLIEEPTNHLDREAREIIKKYLAGKKGFILVSHDRDFLDACIDHVLVFNRVGIQVQAGTFSSWWENKEREDKNAMAENEKHLKEITKLKESVERSRRWADKNEGTKIGFDPVQEHDRFLNTRSYIGAKTKKMQSRVKSFEKRMEGEIEEKEGLLNRPERTERNYRLYGDEDIARLRFIRHCRRHGMSLDEIRTLLVYSDHPTGSCDWPNARIHQRIEAVEQQIRDLEHLRAHLESLYHKCDGSREGGCGILKSLIDGENCQYRQARQQRTGREHP